MPPAPGLQRLMRKVVEVGVLDGMLQTCLPIVHVPTKSRIRRDSATEVDVRAGIQG